MAKLEKTKMYEYKYWLESAERCPAHLMILCKNKTDKDIHAKTNSNIRSINNRVVICNLHEN